ncbi:hypothetical protein Ancab_005683 [Ancistrocladus abbreviatus]
MDRMDDNFRLSPNSQLVRQVQQNYLVGRLIADEPFPVQVAKAIIDNSWKMLNDIPIKSVDQIDFSKSPFWVQLHGLQWNLLSPINAVMIGSLIGEALKNIEPGGSFNLKASDNSDKDVPFMSVNDIHKMAEFLNSDNGGMKGNLGLQERGPSLGGSHPSQVGTVMGNMLRKCTLDETAKFYEGLNFCPRSIRMQLSGSDCLTLRLPVEAQSIRPFSLLLGWSGVL